MNKETNISGSQIRVLRDLLNLNKGEFADLLGTSRNTLRKWEEEGLSSISTAADRNLYHIHQLNKRGVLNRLLYNVKEKEKIDFLFALISFFGPAMSLSKESIFSLLTVSKDIIKYLDYSGFITDDNIDDITQENIELRSHASANISTFGSLINNMAYMLKKEYDLKKPSTNSPEPQKNIKDEGNDEN